jgi:hypothetical protein
MNATVSENRVDLHYSQSALQSIKEKLIAADTINQLDIADGLKELLINNGFTIRLLLKTSTSELAKILGIDEYIAKLVLDAAKKIITSSASKYDIDPVK